MSGVASRVRRTLSRALSSQDINESDKDSRINNDSIIEKSVNFLSKFTNSNIQVHSAEKRIDHKSLLVIDSTRNDWTRLFKGRMLHSNSIDIRVEQATLGELQVYSCSEKGASVSMKVIRNGTVIARSFRPDFVLLREYIQGPDQRCDFKNILLGLMHGLVPAVNSLCSAYNFLDKPAVYAELLKIRNRHGRDNFPLIDQNYYQSYDEMLLPPSLPVVVKVGSAHSGYGKVCVASPRGFQDVASLVSLTNTFATSEPFLDGKFDLRILKIGQRYKVYKRKSLSDAWKTNTGSSTVEEIALTERYKFWADECSTLFGGLDIVCVEVIHTKDDKEYIIEVNNIPSSICPDKHEDDMKSMVNVVINRMEEAFAPIVNDDVPAHGITDAIQLISGPPSPNPKPQTSLEINQNYQRPGSAPPMNVVDIDTLETRGNGKKMMNGGSLTSSNTSLEIQEIQDNQDRKPRRGSLAGRFFSALES